MSSKNLFFTSLTKLSGIYEILNTNNNKIYVGSSKEMGEKIIYT